MFKQQEQGALPSMFIFLVSPWPRVCDGDLMQMDISLVLVAVEGLWSSMPEEGEGAATARRKERKQNKARQVKRRGTASAAGYMGAVDCDLRLLVAVGGVSC